MLFLFWTIGSRNENRCVHIIDSGGSNSLRHVFDERLASEAIPSSSTHHGILIGYGDLYVRFGTGHALDQGRQWEHLLGACAVHSLVRLLLDVGFADNSVDDDSGIVPGWYSWNRTLAVLLNGQSVDVLCHSELQVNTLVFKYFGI